MSLGYYEYAFISNEMHVYDFKNDSKREGPRMRIGITTYKMTSFSFFFMLLQT